MTATVIQFPRALRRCDTSDWDLCIASAFVRNRPGWAVEERTGARGRVLAMRTPGEGWGWTIARGTDGLTIENHASGICFGPSPVLRDLLVEVYEAETDGVQIGLQRTGGAQG